MVKERRALAQTGAVHRRGQCRESGTEEADGRDEEQSGRRRGRTPTKPACCRPVDSDHGHHRRVYLDRIGALSQLRRLVDDSSRLLLFHHVG